MASGSRSKASAARQQATASARGAPVRARPTAATRSRSAGGNVGSGRFLSGMRIALVTEFYYPHLGGITEHVHFLARELNRRGHSTIIITSRMQGAGPDEPHVQRIGTSRVVYGNGSFTRVTTGWRLARRVTELLRVHQPDVVHVQKALEPTLGLVASRAAWRLGLPVVSTFHTYFTRALGYEVFRPLLQRRLDRLVARIAVSEPVVRAMSRYFRAEFEIIPNGVDVELFRPNRCRPSDHVEAPSLLFLGRLDPRNGLDTMLVAMPRILERYPAARLVVAGDGPLRRVYERRAGLLGDRVRFVGQVTSTRAEHYCAADLYVCPTTKASFGITLLEAMACGAPLLVSDIPGFRELVDGGAEAVLVPHDDPAAWAEATCALLSEPRRRESMGAAGRAKAERYAWPLVADRILATYARVAG